MCPSVIRRMYNFSVVNWNWAKSSWSYTLYPCEHTFASYRTAVNLPLSTYLCRYFTSKASHFNCFHQSIFLLSSPRAYKIVKDPVGPIVWDILLSDWWHVLIALSISVTGQFMWLFDTVIFGKVLKSEFLTSPSTCRNWVWLRHNEPFLFVLQLCWEYYKARSIASLYDDNWIGRNCTEFVFVLCYFSMLRKEDGFSDRKDQFTIYL